MDRDAAALNALQERLLAHFSSLASERERSGFPIFALEHNLSSEDLSRASILLRDRVRTRRRLAPHWLLWVVYASEAGYKYAGDEYWPSFVERTPNWQFHDRPKVKSWFQRFQSSFNGVVPSGLWAEQFSIIAWPITHAVLPRYLQEQLAKLLYDVRYRLALTSSLDAGSIGRLLAARASHTSTRFQAFLQQEDLTGQIVAALLHARSVDGGDLIYAPALKRVVNDLERVRRSGSWLKETRRVVSDRFKGIGSGTYRVSPSPVRPDEPVLPDTSRFIIRPALFLRHVGAGRWSPVLQLKSLRPVATESAHLRAFLDGTRCRLNGADDWKPTGWLLSGDRKSALRRWPSDAIPLIEFERRNPLMDHLLESEFRTPPGPLWLFRIGADGIARHLTSLTVRPDHDYIVVSAASVPPELPGASPCVLECEGMQACRLAVPGHVSAGDVARLSEVGLNVARTIRVWPAGLPGRGWDGEGRTEWLTTESPCFGIAPDHPLDALTFRLNEDEPQVLATDPQDGHTFVRLRPLQAGTHMLTVEAQRSPGLDRAVSTPPAKGYVSLEVREPEPWTPGIASHPGLVVTKDPYDASLDLFWRNELNLSVNGPEGFAVRLNVRLYAADGRKILAGALEPPMHLPITPEAWRNTFARFVNNRSRAWKYVEAASCTLEINAESLGTCNLTFEHDPSPLRWVVGSKQRRTVVRLVDDTGQHDSDPDVWFYCMERPLDGIRLEAGAARTGQVVKPPGGLFLAHHSPFSDAAVVSSPVPHVGLKDLGVEPDVDVAAGPPLREAFRMLRAWHGARQAGFLAGTRQSQVISSIINAIFGTMCGENWARAERSFVEQPRSQHALSVLRELVHRRSQLGRPLSRHSDPDEGEEAAANRFADVVEVHHVSFDRDLCRFALRLAIRPTDVLADPLLDERVKQLAENPALVRGARLVALLRAHHRD